MSVSERLANARQQLGEQVVEIQMRQGGIGDELKPSKPLGVAGGGHSHRIRGGPTDTSWAALQGLSALLRSWR